MIRVPVDYCIVDGTIAAIRVGRWPRSALQTSDRDISPIVGSDDGWGYVSTKVNWLVGIITSGGLTRGVELHFRIGECERPEHH